MRSFNGNKYGYQGSEKNTELGANDYYTHFRGLDVEVGRWKQIDPKNEEQLDLSPYISMNNNPVSNVDPLGDKIHASFRTWYYLWKESKGDAALRQEIRRQMFDVRTSQVMRNGRLHQETYSQHYYYDVNFNSSITLRQEVFNNQALNASRGRNNVPANNDHYPQQGFNVIKTEHMVRWGKGDGGNATPATTLTSKKAYQTGTVDIRFTPNFKDVSGADRIRVFQGKTLIYDDNIPVNPNDPSGAGYSNIPINLSGTRGRIKIKITDNDGVNNSSPGAFDIKVRCLYPQNTSERLI